jgi:hypothetical protein
LPADRPPTAGRAPALRSAVTNNRRHFLLRGGEQSIIGRRHRDIFEAVVEDLGGPNHVSEAQRQLTRRAAQLSIEAEIMEAERAEGGELNVAEYVTLVNALARVLTRLGVERLPRDITPTVEQIVAAHDERAKAAGG